MCKFQDGKYVKQPTCRLYGAVRRRKRWFVLVYSFFYLSDIFSFFFLSHLSLFLFLSLSLCSALFSFFILFSIPRSIECGDGDEQKPVDRLKKARIRTTKNRFKVEGLSNTFELCTFYFRWLSVYSLHYWFLIQFEYSSTNMCCIFANSAGKC